MIPIYQTTCYNCLQACIASILELNIGSVADIYGEVVTKKINWTIATNNYLIKHNKRLKQCDVYDICNEYHLIVGKVKILDNIYCHAMVGYKGRVIFDPDIKNEIKPSGFKILQYFAIEDKSD